MLYPRKNDGKLEKDLFENPGSEYRGTPFWAWNCRVTKELIKDQLGVFKKMGFGGAHLHPRTGLDNAYMGKEYSAVEIDCWATGDRVCRFSAGPKE